MPRSASRTPRQRGLGALYRAPDGTMWKKARILPGEEWEAAFWAAAADVRIGGITGATPDGQERMRAMGWEPVS